MPYVNFNVARVRNANDFKEDSFRTIKGGEHMFPKAGLVVVPEEIRVISGQLKEVENEQYRAPMELLFPIDKYEAESDVRTWLENENIEMIDYYPAGEGKMDDEEEERALEDIDLTPTDEMINEAKKGLEWRKEFNRGGTDVGVGTAEAIINKSITLDRVKRMYSYFSRHEVDKKAEGFEYGEDGFPSNGRIAWALWSGDAGFEWSKRKVEQIKEEEKNNRDIIGYLITDGIELPLFETIEEAEEEAEKLGGSGYHEHKVDETIYFMPFESHAEAMNVLKENNISKEEKTTIKEYNNFKIKNMERRLFANEFRVVDDKKKKSKKIIGYASVFNSDSQDLGGFIERINPNAFDNVIEDNQDVRALFNHNADLGVLGRTTSGTLRLSVDEKGLKYEIDAPDTQLARDLIASMERGDITQSSFGFTISENGDSWDEDSEGRTIRTISQVDTLFDISPVVFPAYTLADSSVALRGFDNYKENKQKTENTKEKTDLHERNLRELKLKMIK
jgi:HK97 family phage prohead protease